MSYLIDFETVDGNLISIAHDTIVEIRQRQNVRTSQVTCFIGYSNNDCAIEVEGDRKRVKARIYAQLETYKAKEQRAVNSALEALKDTLTGLMNKFGGSTDGPEG